MVRVFDTAPAPTTLGTSLHHEAVLSRTTGTCGDDTCLEQAVGLTSDCTHGQTRGLRLVLALLWAGYPAEWHLTIRPCPGS